MKARLLIFWDTLHTSYWFIPSLMTLMAILLSVVTLNLENNFDKDWAHEIPGIWSGGADGAREVLSTIAGSMITVAGVVFSITIVALTLASSQFGPRLLRNFMADTGNQVVLGTFIATYIYCLLILRSVQGIEDHIFVPYLSVTVGLVMAVLSLGVLIYFIHHVSDSIQAENLIATVGKELLDAVTEMFPEKAGEPGLAELPEPVMSANMDQEFKTLPSSKNGYLQSVNSEQLIELATKHRLILVILHRPGAFISKGEALIKIWEKEELSEEAREKIQDAFICGAHRTPTQDIAYPIHQLVEVALRALSPSVNDPFTALSCIDWLGTGLLQLLDRKYPSRYRYDENHKLRLIANTYTFPSLADATFNPLRSAGKQHLVIMVRLMEKIQLCADHIKNKEDLQSLQFHAAQIYADGNAELLNEADKEKLSACYQQTTRLLHQVELGKE